MRFTSITRPLFRQALKFSASVVLILMLACGGASAQKGHLFDSLKRNLSLAQTDEDKVYVLGELVDQYSGLDNELCRQYAEQSIRVAELSRDRKLIILAYLQNGARCMNLAALEGNIQEALENYENAERIAREAGLDDWLAYSYTGLAGVFRSEGQYDKALNYNNLALSIASGTSNDSLKMVVDISLKNIYLARNEKLLAFRSCLEAMNVAELSRKDALQRSAYENIEEFYSQIGEHDKALDYAMKMLAIDLKNHDRYKQLDDYNLIGNQFGRKKKIDLALSMFEHSTALADSLQFDAIKINTYLNITNMYFRVEGSVKGMAYLQKHKEITDLFYKTGLGSFLDMSYGEIYAELHQFDSAYYFLKKSETEIEQNGNPDAKYTFYTFFGDFYKKKGDYKKAISYYLKARNIGEGIKNLDYLEACARNLDTLYDRTGDYKTAYFYNTEQNVFSDSLKSLANATDLLKLEVDNDARRRERLAKEEEENTLRRHNIQYMGLTVGLGCLFILLVMAGLFVVHPGTIRALGFFSFIFLFEFIILIADKQIQQWTHEEPWKVLCIKILLAAILLPLHHWLEHKVIHYLTARKKFAAPGRSIWARVLGRKQNANPGAV
jgi:tetratricopeptide (TPR) repeat protein